MAESQTKPRAKSQAESKAGSKAPYLRLGVNIDHVATIRNARGGAHPDPVDAAMVAIEAGADGITAHLREDRRHIRDADIANLKARITKPLNLEMAATDEMLAIALEHCPNAACLVPENRQEVTTEGGLDVVGQMDRLVPIISSLRGAKIRVSLFIEPDAKQIEAAASAGADIVEFHTGRYCAADTDKETVATELARIVAAAKSATAQGLECHAGHGLNFETVEGVAAIAQIVELNIGHFLIGESVTMGLGPALKEMRRLMDNTRAHGVDGA